jgi:8-oxo-dGTP diphosphatase
MPGQRRRGLYLTTSQAARAVDISQRTLLRWAKRGDLTPAASTPGGHLKWDLDDLRSQLTELRRRSMGGPRTTETSDQSIGLSFPDARDPEDFVLATDPEPQPVVAAIIVSKLGLLVTRRRDRTPPWGFLTGELEPGESPNDTALREAKEEAGLEIVVGRLIGRRVHPMTDRTMIYVAAHPAHTTDVHIGDKDELLEIRWVDNMPEVDQLLPRMHQPVRDYLAGHLKPS